MPTLCRSSARRSQVSFSRGHEPNARPPRTQITLLSPFFFRDSRSPGVGCAQRHKPVVTQCRFEILADSSVQTAAFKRVEA